MIEAIKQFVISADFVFAIIIIGFIVVVALLLLENRRDNQKLVQLNQKIKSAKWDEDAIFFKSDLFCDLPLSMDFTMGSLIQRGRLGAPRAA